MPVFNTKPIKYNTAGEAARKEQKRNADLDRQERNKSFPVIFVKEYGFRPQYTGHESIHVNGPLCPGSISKDRQCLAPLVGDDANSTKARCEVCGRNYTMPHGFEEFRRIADKAYEGFLHSKAEIITLDVPYEAVKAEAEDATRWVKVVWSQKDGRNQAIIYFIGKDAKGEKTQIFADLDREEIRYDAGDIPPGKILAKVKAEFRETKVDIEYNKE